MYSKNFQVFRMPYLWPKNQIGRFVFPYLSVCVNFSTKTFFRFFSFFFSFCFNFSHPHHILVLRYEKNCLFVIVCINFKHYFCVKLNICTNRFSFRIVVHAYYIYRASVNAPTSDSFFSIYLFPKLQISAILLRLWWNLFEIASFNFSSWVLHLIIIVAD